MTSPVDLPTRQFLTWTYGHWNVLVVFNLATTVTPDRRRWICMWGLSVEVYAMNNPGEHMILKSVIYVAIVVSKINKAIMYKALDWFIKGMW
jgi:hypothetical protein